MLGQSLSGNRLFSSYPSEVYEARYNIASNFKNTGVDFELFIVLRNVFVVNNKTEIS